MLGSTASVCPLFLPTIFAPYEIRHTRPPSFPPSYLVQPAMPPSCSQPAPSHAADLGGGGRCNSSNIKPPAPLIVGRLLPPHLPKAKENVGACSSGHTPSSTGVIVTMISAIFSTWPVPRACHLTQEAVFQLSPKSSPILPKVPFCLSPSWHSRPVARAQYLLASGCPILLSRSCPSVPRAKYRIRMFRAPMWMQGTSTTRPHGPRPQFLFT